jgi:polysaccharide export outer membrane protein
MGVVWRIQSKGQTVMVGQGPIAADGTIMLGKYGSAQLAGLTLDQACKQIEATAAPYVAAPHANVFMSAYAGGGTQPHEVITDTVAAAPQAKPVVAELTLVKAAEPAVPVVTATTPAAPAVPVVVQVPPVVQAPVVAAPAPATPVATAAPAAPQPLNLPAGSPYASCPGPIASVTTHAAPPTTTDSGIQLAVVSKPIETRSVIQAADWRPVTQSAPTIDASKYRPIPADSVPAPLNPSKWAPLQHGNDSGLITVSWQPTDHPSAGVPIVSGAPEPGPDVIAPIPQKMPSSPQAPPPPGPAPMVEASIGVPLPHPQVPHECARVSLPPYVIDPPDILLVEATGVLPDQPIGGPHLVRPDGTISLGVYGGSVYVAGMTLEQAREVIRAQIATRVKDFKKDDGSPLVPDTSKVNLSVDVAAYNSKYYYVISDGGGLGQQVTRHPITGNETVLDAVTQVGGLSPVSSKHHITLARPCGRDGHPHVYNVDWKNLTMCAAAGTNYQLMPGDRVYVDSQALVKTDTALARFFAPIERVFGVVLLGSSTVNSIKNGNNNNGNNTGR